MKRFFFTVIAIAAAAVSCTKSGLIESPQTYETPISFEPYTGRVPMTKATVVETTNIETDGFRVIGFEQAADGSITPANPHLKRVVIKGDHDNDSKTEAAWYYHIPMYWQENQKLTFVAYGLNVNSNKTIDTDTGDIDESKTTDADLFQRGSDYTKFTYSVPPTVAAQKDLVISPTMKDKNSTSGTIAVNLYHALSRVGFSVRTEGNANTKANVVINEISMTGGFATSATFDLSKIDQPAENVKTLTYNTANYTAVIPKDETDAEKNAATTYSLLTGTNTFTTAGATGTADPTNQYIKTYPIVNGTDRYMMILPGTVADVVAYTDTYDVDKDGNITEKLTTPYIKVRYQITNAQEQTVAIPLQITKNGSTVNFPFEAGKAYEFVFTVSTVEVGFNVSVGIWEPKATDADGKEIETTDPIEENFDLN